MPFSQDPFIATIAAANQTDQPIPNITINQENATAVVPVTITFPTLSNLLIMPELPNLSLNSVAQATPTSIQTSVPRNASTVQVQDLANALYKIWGSFGTSYKGYSDELANRMRS